MQLARKEPGLTSLVLGFCFAHTPAFELGPITRKVALDDSEEPRRKRPRGEEQMFTLSQVGAAIWHKLSQRLDVAILHTNVGSAAGDVQMEAMRRSCGWNTTVESILASVNQKMVTSFGRLLVEESDLEVVGVDVCVAFASDFAREHIGVCVDEGLVSAHISPICRGTLEPTRFLAKTFVRGTVFEELLGKSLATRLRAAMHDTHWSLEARGARMDPDVLAAELVAARHELLYARAAVAYPSQSRPYLGEVGKSFLMARADSVQSRAADGRRSKDTSASQKWEELKRIMVQHKFETHTAFTHQRASLAAGAEIVMFAKTSTKIDAAAVDKTMKQLVSYSTMRKFVLEMDKALDLWHADCLLKVGADRSTRLAITA